MHIYPIIIFLFIFLAAEYIGFVNVIFAPALATLTKTLTRNYDLGFVDYLKKYSSENSLDEAVDTEEIVEA